MDIAVVYNFAEHPGGGDLVALGIIETLLERGYTVSLYTFQPEGIRRAALYFDKDLKTFDGLNVRRIEAPKAIKHPYNIYVITKKAFSELKQHDLTIFFDDIPEPARELKKILVYVHYPHAARILLNQLVSYRYRGTLKGRIVWKLHSTLFRRYFLTNWDGENIYVIANSTLTYDHVFRALRPRHLVKIYPPVQVRQIMVYTQRVGRSKEDLVVYVGRIQPEKGIDDVIKVAALLRRSDVKFKIMGFGYDNKYLEYLRSLVKELGIQRGVEMEVNATREEVLESLAKAKVIVHPAHYEPFGIAVIEGLVAGCIPVVRKGFNGPWIDIVEQGRYGLGFENPEELAQAINTIISDSRAVNIDDVAKRALEFDEEVFKNRFVAYLEDILAS
ncbi:MAG: hypothetical protein B7O98_08925 [Zestosphaera tikiterensis]|uniref:Glycosyl transferase family 1 domain-containing protein n=1 Tax=Zestosphaera tikiterensis TaxID=1973259 RepID=A0A2R7Y250_9CREN|nr:MAG: hypothetical protein B7O98_08925 [Zestosphaera tikiterensis]